jgi:23S rRNA pseudouridine1911/1915/1917 synthase
MSYRPDRADAPAQADDDEPAYGDGDGDGDGDEWAAAGPEPDAGATTTVTAAPGAPALIEQRFLVESECHGWRLDRFLQKKIRRLSRSRIQRVINGDCDVDGRPARPALRVYTGNTVSFRRPAPSEPAVPRDISVRYADADLYILDKPAGLPIHPTARYHYSTLTAVLRERFPGETLRVCHRLDRETSGLLIVARTPEAESAVKKAFARRLIKKRYLAIVNGAFTIPDAHDGGPLIVDQPIGPAGGLVRVRMAVRPLEQGGQPARTEVRVLQRLSGPGPGDEATLVECRPHTGRQHQIRVHLWALGHPILGDKLYPDEELFLEWAEGGDDVVRERLPLLRHALHAAGLSLLHPRTGTPLCVDSPLPPDLQAFVTARTPPKNNDGDGDDGDSNGGGSPGSAPAGS